MNSCRRVISCPEFLYMEETDIVHEIRDQDVIVARRI